MLKRLLALLTLAAGPALAAPPPADLSLGYRAYIGGLPLGELDLRLRFNEAGYQASGDFKMVTLLRLILDADARAKAEGVWGAGGRAQARRFTYWLRDGDEVRDTAFRFDAAGRPVAVEASPPFRDKSYDMAIEEAAEAFDPATAAAMLAAPRAEACGLSMEVFDGRKLHRITLTPASSAPSANGLIDCDGLYERVAGFKKKHMTPARRSYRFKARLMPRADGLFIPAQVSAGTEYGAASVTLQRGG